MTRVLHVTGVPEGGVFELLLSLQKAIDKDKIQFDYILPDSRPLAGAKRKIEELGGRVYVCPALGYRNYFKLGAFFNDFFKTHQEYKIVHAHGPNIAVVCLKNAKEHGVPHRLCHSHNTKYADTLIKSIRNRILLAGLRNYATGYLACSAAAGKFLFGNEDVYILKNGIQTEKFAFDFTARERLRAELGLGDGFIIGHVGLMRGQKNHEFMLRVLEKYRELFDEGKLLLVGDGELRGELERQARELGISEHVVFAGLREDVPQLMSAMDVFLMPSLYEGLGIALIEAQASGLPCIYSDVIPPEAKLTKIACSLSLDESAESWARALREAGARGAAAYAARGEAALNGPAEGERRAYVQEVRAAGYDIADCAEKLAEYYFKIRK